MKHNFVKAKVSILENSFKAKVKDHIVIKEINEYMDGKIFNPEQFQNTEFEIIEIINQSPKVIYFNCAKENCDILLRNIKTDKEYMLNSLEINEYVSL